MFPTVLLISIGIFALAMLGLATGLLVRNKVMTHSCCGGELCSDHDIRCEHEESCDDCPKRLQESER